jgi:hypothetical protein
MSVLSEDMPTEPQDPLHYAPRRTGQRPEVRLSAVGTTAGETAFDRPSRFEPARRPPPSSALSAELEHAVFESLRRRMDPEVVPEPPALAQEQSQRRAWLAIGAAFGIAAIAAILFVAFTSRDEVGALLSSAAPASQAQDDASKPALAQFRALLNSGDGKQAVTREQSERLLKQFEQWRQKADGQTR